MSDATARFALPFIAPGQAQKELFHNEALMRIDAALQPTVEAIAQDDPPAAPTVGQCWVVGAAPTGAWAGQGGTIAAWSDGGWRFVAPLAGTTAWSRADGLFARYDGNRWILGEIVGSRVIVGGVQVVGMQQAAIAAPTGGSVIDVEARATLSAIIAVLKSHGLTAM